MKSIFKSMLVSFMAGLIALSSFVMVSAEEITPANDESIISIFEEGSIDSSKAYELVWKFKIEGSHLYKRRWNMTLGIWYDPEWILVY